MRPVGRRRDVGPWWHVTGRRLCGAIAVAFEPVAGVPQSLVDQGTVWKVTGRSANEVYFSASDGTVLNWDGNALTAETIGASGESLFSIGCSADRCITAGTNTTNGVLYANDGAGWTSRVPTTDGPVWRGVTPVGNTYIVGQFGTVLRANSATRSDENMRNNEITARRWSTPDGDVFAVGVDLIALYVDCVL